MTAAARFQPVNEVLDAKAARKRRQAFYTPLALVAKLVEWADVSEYTTCLEPSAGDGRIVHALRAAGAVSVAACEVEAAMHPRIESAGGTVVGTDFLAHSGARYDRIVMNPPFKGKQCPRHIEHAWTLLAPGGVLLSVAPTTLVDDVREQRLNLHGCEWATVERLDGDLFKEFGTGIEVAVVELREGRNDRPGDTGGFANQATWNAALAIETDAELSATVRKDGCDRAALKQRVVREIVEGGGSGYGIAWSEVWEHVAPGAVTRSQMEIEEYLRSARAN
ncbi:hypothetical protein [Gemmata sp.]|uniref:hypothetical protein n=1 Tax=Gemmata sp. TaxID=1914242 RepID=UPI003F72B0A9